MVCENPYIRKKITHTEGGREAAWTSTPQTTMVTDDRLAPACPISPLAPLPRLQRQSLKKISGYRPAQERQPWCISL